jgi:CheY-like chemotaxis protein
MERELFDELVRDLLANLYDFSVLETHPFTQTLSIPDGYAGSRGEFLRAQTIHAIERLQPPGKKLSLDSPEWRAYLILHARYIEGKPVQEIAAALSLSERQIRRDHARALHGVSALLWDMFHGHTIGDSASPHTDSLFEAADDLPASAADFPIHLIPLDIHQVLPGVLQTMEKRLQAEQVAVEQRLADDPVLAQADRIILRQILIALVDDVLRSQPLTSVQIVTHRQPEEASIILRWMSASSERLSEGTSLHAIARYWCQRTGAVLEETQALAGSGMRREIRLRLPAAGEAQHLILVVDDQQPTLRMYQRYLSRSAYEVVGVQDPQQVPELARRLRPAAITLDVMMPDLDGWELLQTLQADEMTRAIPVVVCSAWVEPDLALSLGASQFLKKPVTQRDLLRVLRELGLRV